jgi:hypothetical protein
MMFEMNKHLTFDDDDDEEPDWCCTVLPIFLFFLTCDDLMLR